MLHIFHRYSFGLAGVVLVYKIDVAGKIAEHIGLK